MTSRGSDGLVADASNSLMHIRACEQVILHCEQCLALTRTSEQKCLKPNPDHQAARLHRRQAVRVDLALEGLNYGGAKGDEEEHEERAQCFLTLPGLRQFRISSLIRRRRR